MRRHWLLGAVLLAASLAHALPGVAQDKPYGLRGTLEYYRGNDTQTQFKSDREHFLAIGFAADF